MQGMARATTNFICITTGFNILFFVLHCAHVFIITSLLFSNVFNILTGCTLGVKSVQEKKKEKLTF